MGHVFDETLEISLCKVCKLYEGGLTTHCSGEDSLEKSDDIYEGKLDYRKGEGWVKKLNPTNKMWVAWKIYAKELGNKDAPQTKEEIMGMLDITSETYDDIEEEVKKTLNKV